jgi:hypothetical protein
MAVYEKLLSPDLDAPWNRYPRELLADEAGHGAARQAEKVGMATRASLPSGRVDDIAQAAVDALDAMNEACLFHELEVAIDGHPIETREQIDDLAVGHRAGRLQERRQ